MQARLTRPLSRLNPDYSPADREACRRSGRPYAVPRTAAVPAGELIDHADAWRLVRMGVAEPADAECEAAAGMTPAARSAAAAAYERLASGRATGDPNLDADAADAESPRGRRRRKADEAAPAE